MTKALSASILAWLALVLVPCAAGADPVTDGILKCSADDDSVSRLACFDAIAAGLKSEADKAAEASLPQADGDVGRWRVKVETSRIDDSTNVLLTIVSNETVRDSFGRRSPAFLTIRCIENTTSLVLSLGNNFLSDIQGYGDVTLRADREPARVVGMKVSTDNKALGLWSGGASIPLIRELLNRDALLARVTPFNESPITVEFEIAGLSEAIKPLAAACNWTP